MLDLFGELKDVGNRVLVDREGFQLLVQPLCQSVVEYLEYLLWIYKLLLRRLIGN